MRLDWLELSADAGATDTAPSFALLGDGGGDGLAAAFAASLHPQQFPDLAALQAALDRGAAAPGLVLAPLPAAADSDPVGGARQTTTAALALLQGWMADPRLVSTTLALVTRSAISAQAGERLGSLDQSPVWGLVRTAQGEHPDLPLVLIDIDVDGAGAGAGASTDASLRALLPALAAADRAGERQLARRRGARLVPRLVRARAAELLEPPAVPHWRLHTRTKGTFDDLALVPHPDAFAPLTAGQVRLAVRAAGLLNWFPPRVRKPARVKGRLTYNHRARTR